MLSRIVSIVFPIFLIVAVGFLYGKRNKTDMSAANKLNMEIFLPALIFYALANKSFALADNLPSVIGSLVIVFGSGLIAWPIVRLLGYETKTLIPPIMFNNVGNMGLPLMLLTFGEKALGAAIVLMLIVTLLQFALSPWLIQRKAPLTTILKEPFILAAALGVAISITGFSVWEPAMKGCKIIADISLGLMIFSLGIRLSTAKFDAWKVGLTGAVLTPVTGMICAWLLCALIDIPKADQDILFVFGALPPAVSNFIFAERYNQEPDKVASIVAMGNALSVIFVPIALALRL